MLQPVGIISILTKRSLMKIRSNVWIGMQFNKENNRITHIRRKKNALKASDPDVEEKADLRRYDDMFKCLVWTRVTRLCHAGSGYSGENGDQQSDNHRDIHRSCQLSSGFSQNSFPRVKRRLA